MYVLQHRRKLATNLLNILYMGRLPYRLILIFRYKVGFARVACHFNVEFHDIIFVPVLI